MLSQRDSNLDSRNGVPSVISGIVANGSPHGKLSVNRKLGVGQFQIIVSSFTLASAPVDRAGNSVNGQQKVALADGFTMASSVKSVIATVVALRLDGAITTPQLFTS
jgi:hypothetical protein